MARIGLFPLELVLVPTERVPLNVFEPRYRELVGECLERGEEFGIVLVKESGDVHHVGTRAAIVEVLQVLPDGRLHVVVEGGDRFRLLEVDHERSFDTGSVEELVDQDDPPDPADLERAFETFKRMQETVGVPGEPPDPAAPRAHPSAAASSARPIPRRRWEAATIRPRSATCALEGCGSRTSESRPTIMPASSATISAPSGCRRRART